MSQTQGPDTEHAGCVTLVIGELNGTQPLMFLATSVLLVPQNVCCEKGPLSAP